MTALDTPTELEMEIVRALCRASVMGNDWAGNFLTRLLFDPDPLISARLFEVLVDVRNRYGKLALK